MEICSKEEQRQLIEEYFGIKEYALKRHHDED
jgi:hypothetical protein